MSIDSEQTGTGAPLSEVTRGSLAGARITVIGGGLLGTCIAYRLAQAAASVDVVDPQGGSGGASAASFAWLNAHGKYPMDYWHLNAEGMRDYAELHGECGGDWLHPVGSLRWEPAGHPAASELDAAIAASERGGAIVERLSPATARALEPAVAIDDALVDVVHRSVQEGWIDTARLRDSLLAAARRRFGVRVRRASVVGFESGSSVVLDGGQRLDADIVVNAAGADAGDVAALAGSELRVGELTSSLLRTAPVDHGVRGVLATGSVWMRPSDSGGMTIGCSILPPRTDAAEHADEIAEALRRAAEIVPSLAGCRLERVLIGSQPVPEDNYPVVGFDDEVDGLFHAVTRSGATLAPRIAKLTLAAFRDPDTAAIRDFAPARFRRGRLAVGPAGEA